MRALRTWNWSPLGWLSLNQPGSQNSRQFSTPKVGTAAGVELCNDHDDDADGEVDMYQCHAEKPPIIFVPGMAGSVLADVNSNFWSCAFDSAKSAVLEKFLDSTAWEGARLLAPCQVKWPGCLNTNHWDLTLNPNAPEHKGEDILPVDIVGTTECGQNPEDFPKAYAQMRTFFLFSHFAGLNARAFVESPFVSRTLANNPSERRQALDSGKGACGELDPNNYVHRQFRWFSFPYDWRKDDRLAAEKLHQLVQCVSQLHGGSKVDIVSHSNGGLVTRRYLVDHGAEGKVRQFVPLSAPWLGVPKLANVIETGEFVDKRLASQEQIRELMMHFTGAHQLLPVGQVSLDLNQTSPPFRCSRSGAGTTTRAATCPVPTRVFAGSRPTRGRR